jgi:hypothetical protein
MTCSREDVDDHSGLLPGGKTQSEIFRICQMEFSEVIWSNMPEQILVTEQ